MTFRPDGDREGPDDGFSGSLFILGHDQGQLVAEISIPAPVISDDKDPQDLPRASFIQPFADITGGRFGTLEIPRAGIEYSSRGGGRLYFCWGEHFEFEKRPTHGWSSTNLSGPDPHGPWSIDGYTSYATNDYLLRIPESWSNESAPGTALATGRFRDGLWSGRGPALFAIPEYDEPDQDIRAIPLLLYGTQAPGALEIESSLETSMDHFSEPDEWSGAEWLEQDGRSALIFIGTKAIGRSWYGFSDGVVYPTSGDENETYPDVPPWPHDQRGWWAESISGSILFYDPSDLGAVARGEMESWEPQPYSSMDLDRYLFDPGYDFERGKMNLLGDSAYDDEHGLLYIVERLADEDRSIVHAFKVG